MTLFQFLALITPLGLGGFSPLPALVAAVFLAGRSIHRKRNVFAFGVLLIGGTTLWGLMLSQVVGTRLAEVPWPRIIYAALDAGPLTALGKLVIATPLLWYSIRSWRRGWRTRPAKKVEEKTFIGLLLVAVFYIIAFTIDVPYITAITLASKQPAPAAALGLLMWAIVAHSPTFALCCSVLAGKDKAFTCWLTKTWDRISPYAWQTVAVISFVVGLSLAADALLYPLWGNMILLNFWSHPPHAPHPH